MAAKLKIKKGDQVVVITGKDKGKTGEVKKVLVEDRKLIVAGVNVQTKNRKPSATNAGGQEKVESPIHVSNVAIVDPKTKKPSRVGYKTVGDKKTRVAKRSGEAID